MELESWWRTNTDNSAGAGATPTAGSVKIDGSNLGSALAGTIPATKLSANTTAGFSIVTYTGTGVQRCYCCTWSVAKHQSLGYR